MEEPVISNPSNDDIDKMLHFKGYMHRKLQGLSSPEINNEADTNNNSTLSETKEEVVFFSSSREPSDRVFDLVEFASDFVRHPAFPWVVTTAVLAGVSFLLWCFYMYLYKDVDRTEMYRSQYRSSKTQQHKSALRESGENHRAGSLVLSTPSIVMVQQPSAEDTCYNVPSAAIVDMSGYRDSHATAGPIDYHDNGGHELGISPSAGGGDGYDNRTFWLERDRSPTPPPLPPRLCEKVPDSVLELVTDQQVHSRAISPDTSTAGHALLSDDTTTTTSRGDNSSTLGSDYSPTLSLGPCADPFSQVVMFHPGVVRQQSTRI